MSEQEISYDDAFDEAVDGSSERQDNADEFVSDLEEGEEQAEKQEEQEEDFFSTEEQQEVNKSEVDGDNEEEVEEDDVWSTASDKAKAEYQNLRQEIDALTHKFKSNEGRWQAAQRVLTEKSKQSQQPKPIPSKKDIQAALQDNEKWKPFQQDYPDIADIFQDQATRWQSELETLRSQVEQQRQDLQPSIQQLEQAEHQRRVEAERATLTQRHADWQEIVNTPEFQKWTQLQPPSTQQALSSYSAEENSAVLDRYKDQRKVAEMQQRLQALEQERTQHTQRTKTLEHSRTLPPNESAASLKGNPTGYDEVWDAIT